MKRSVVLTILLIIVAVGAVIGGLIWLRLQISPPIIEGEIREYNGQKLDSVNDFITQTINGIPNIGESNYTLTITGLVQNATVLTYNDVVNKYTHYQKVVTLHCVEGWEVTALWEGIRVKDLLQSAGYNESAQIVIFYAQDGYTTSVPLSYIADKNITIAFKVNGLTLPADRGYPFRLVAEGKLGYKWIKWITKIEVSNDVNFRGYWESNGYDNNANWP